MAKISIPFIKHWNPLDLHIYLDYMSVHEVSEDILMSNLMKKIYVQVKIVEGGKFILQCFSVVCGSILADMILYIRDSCKIWTLWYSLVYNFQDPIVYTDLGLIEIIPVMW